MHITFWLIVAVVLVGVLHSGRATVSELIAEAMAWLGGPRRRSGDEETYTVPTHGATHGPAALVGAGDGTASGDRSDRDG